MLAGTMANPWRHFAPSDDDEDGSGNAPALPVNNAARFFRGLTAMAALFYQPVYRSLGLHLPAGSRHTRQDVNRVKRDVFATVRFVLDMVLTMIAVMPDISWADANFAVFLNRVLPGINWELLSQDLVRVIVDMQRTTPPE
jgi:hypothetical protein